MPRSRFILFGPSLVLACLGCGGTDAVVGGVEPPSPPGSLPSEPPGGGGGGGSSSGATASSSSGGSSSGGASSGSSGSSGTVAGASCAIAKPGTVLVPPFNVRKIAGDGQAISSSWPNLDPIVVEVHDANGLPAKDQTVTFTGQGDAWAVPASVVTDECGRAQSGARGQKAQLINSYTKGSIVASVGASTTTFSVTIFDQVFAPTIQVLAPSAMDLGAGTVGAVATGAVRVVVAPSTGPFSGQGVADIGVRLIGLDASGNPDLTKTGIASCAGGTVMTNSAGIATCDVRFDVPGDGVGLIVGGRTVWKLSTTIAP